MQISRKTALVCAAFLVTTTSIPAWASLEFETDYSAMPQQNVEYEYTEYTGSVTCEPDMHYVPTFVRSPEGAIIGVSYMEIIDTNAC